MKKLLTIITILILWFSFSSNVLIAEDVREELDAIERERIQKIEEQLLLNLPEISDNPNHIITFKDPSEQGVFLEIDGQEFEEITSPYTLPSLSLGRHVLVFKFTDQQGTEQTFERTITIIPRPAVLNPPAIVENEIKISGTAMANSEVEIFLSRDISNQKALVEVDANGEWEHIFTEDIEEGIYTALATTRRNGFSSYYSEPIVFEIGADSETITPVQQRAEGTSFSFSDFDITDYRGILQTLRNNPDLLIAFGSFFLLGILLAWIALSIISKITQKKTKKVLQDLLKKKEEEVEKVSSLREKFENSKGEEDNEKEEKQEKKEKDEKKEKEEEKKKEKKKEKKEEKKKEEEEEKEEEKEEVVEEEKEKEKEEDDDEEAKTLTKKEFMEKFKELDPDDEEGNEKDLKKKNIKISLTSKD